MKYQIRIVKENNYIIVEEYNTKEESDYMYIWYVNHNEFFNGSIQQWYDNKCLAKTKEA